MSDNVIVFSWERSLPGREQLSGAHFDEFVGYLTKLQQAGTIHGWNAVFLSPVGRGTNGFFLVQGESAKIVPLYHSDGWTEHMIRAGMHLDGVTCVTGITGEGLMERMGLWRNVIPG